MECQKRRSNELKCNVSILPNHNATKPHYLKQNYSIHYVTLVTFCITVLLLPYFWEIIMSVFLLECLLLIIGSSFRCCQKDNYLTYFKLQNSAPYRL